MLAMIKVLDAHSTEVVNLDLNWPDHPNFVVLANS